MLHEIFGLSCRFVFDQDVKKIPINLGSVLGPIAEKHIFILKTASVMDIKEFLATHILQTFFVSLGMFLSKRTLLHF
jgi:hypothetical protein